MPDSGPPPQFEHQSLMKPGSSKLHLDPGAPSSGKAPAPAPRSAKPAARRRALSVDDFVQGVRRGDRAVLGRAITLIESGAERHLQTAQQLLTAVMPDTGAAMRIGITGVPGVGKSTFIETLGCNLTAMGKRVAVLAVDPSSGRTGGSVLGDKTRMSRLSVDANAFIRPSPSAGTLGGVARKTRETMLICEAAGYDIVLVETVGVGQSETVVAEMTDFFLVLMLPGAGDELQGIKRGVIEIADMIAVNKADGDNLSRARRAAQDYANALHYMQPAHPDWRPPVITCSARENQGLDELWEKIESHNQRMHANGAWAARRREQMRTWMWSMVDDRLKVMLKSSPAVRSILADVERKVEAGELPPTVGALRILEAFGKS